MTSTGHRTGIIEFVTLARTSIYNKTMYLKLSQFNLKISQELILCISYTVCVCVRVEGFRTMNGYPVHAPTSEIQAKQLHFNSVESLCGPSWTKRPSRALVHRQSSGSFSLTYRRRNTP